MTATFSDRKEKFCISHRKERNFARQISAIAINKDGQAKEVVTLRFYCTRTRVYSCVWVDGTPRVYRCGSDWVQGGNAHLGSYAAGLAIENAGIDLSENIKGVGWSAVKEALIAITKAAVGEANVKRVFICEAYG